MAETLNVKAEIIFGYQVGLMIQFPHLRFNSFDIQRGIKTKLVLSFVVCRLSFVNNARSTNRGPFQGLIVH